MERAVTIQYGKRKKNYDEVNKYEGIGRNKDKRDEEKLEKTRKRKRRKKGIIMRIVEDNR